MTNNAELLGLVLTVMPMGKIKDSYFKTALQTCMGELNKVNESTWPDDLSRDWVARAIHLQISHVRNLKKYRARFEYKLSKFNTTKMEILERLMALVTDSPIQVSQPVVPATGLYSTYEHWLHGLGPQDVP